MWIHSNDSPFDLKKKETPMQNDKAQNAEGAKVPPLSGFFVVSKGGVLQLWNI